MRPIIIAANWKMNTTPADAGPLAAAIAAATDLPEVQRVICPPYVCLTVVRDALAGTNVAVGAQNVHVRDAGAYTGEISAAMLAGLAEWCIVGHSERRRDMGETDELIGRKVARCLESGLRPIWCVGEQLEEREAGRAEEVVREQVRRALVAGGLTGGAWADQIVIAYEPVWAIGTGRTTRGSDAAAMADAIRSALEANGWTRDASAAVPVLYGGSVTAASIGEFLAEPAIDGALVGGASLKPDEMAGIVASAATAAAARLSAAR
ncbi:MAG: triose-phosphate isomerase [Candidatus Limnocylindrales bacterium]